MNKLIILLFWASISFANDGIPDAFDNDGIMNQFDNDHDNSI